MRKKKIIGRKRFVAVDTLGLLWALLVVPASVQDRVGGIALVERLHGAVKRLKKLWGDSHFDTAVSEAWCRWGWIGVVVRKLVGQVGFVVLPKRWIVERTFGWLNASVGCPRITNAPRPAVKRLSRSPDSSNDPSLETLLIPLFGQTLNMRRIIIVTVTISLCFVIPIMLMFSLIHLLLPEKRHSSDKDVSKSMKRGNIIITNVLAYKAKSGKPPESLEKLVPEYMDHIPLPVAGTRQWIYSTWADGSFSLGFEASGGYPHCHYSSSMKEWVGDS